MRWLHRSACAGRCRRCTDIGFIEKVEQGFTLDIGETKMRGSGDLGVARHGLDDIGQRVEQCVDQAVAQHTEACDLGVTLDIGETQCFGHRHDARNVVRATAAISFLPTTLQQRLEHSALANHERTDAFRPAEFVRRQRQKIDVREDLTNVEPAGCLNRIGVQECLRRVLAHRARDVGDGADGADLIVDGHDRHHGYIGAERRHKAVEIDTAGSIDGHHTTAAVLDRVQDGVMLSSRAHSDTAMTTLGSDDRGAVCLGAATGEHHFTRLAADDTGHDIACFIDSLTHGPREAMRATGIREAFGKERQHRLHSLNAHRRSGGVIEVGERGCGVHPDEGTGALVKRRGSRRRSRATVWATTATAPSVDGARGTRMQGYDSTSYGEAIADVYDEWYGDISDLDATVTTLTELASRTGGLPIVELGVGTGRLAVPLAQRVDPTQVIGIDSSPAMLARLADKQGDKPVHTILGDMIDDLPDTPLGVVFVAFNTFFNLGSEERQRQCIRAVAQRLAPNGCFVVEALVPDHLPRNGSLVEVKSLTRDRVVLSVAKYNGIEQSAEGQFIEFTEHAGIRLRPWSIRYASPEQLDEMAGAAGLTCRDRWQSFARDLFTEDSTRHVSVFTPI